MQWQTITGTDANKATLSADPEGRGQRVFPEKSTPTGEIENKFELVFTLEAAATTNTTLYFKIFDPDNFIGLGSNDNNATGYVIDDNYASGTMTGYVIIPASQTSYSFTIRLNTTNGWSGYSTDSNGSTTLLSFTNVHAGDNFIVVADTDQTKVNSAQLGTTATTRYKETNNLTQTELLTVWRTLNVELDVAAWEGMPTGNLKAPLDGFVASELARACIVAEEFTPNNTSVSNVGNDGVSATERELISGNGTGNGRDISGNSNEFWTIRIVMVPFFNNTNTGDYANLVNSYGTFLPSTNTIAICYQKISDAVTNWNNSNDPDVDLQDSIRRNVLHEIGHVLVDASHSNESSIMKTGLNITERLLPDNRKFLDSQIKTLQGYSRARD